MNKLKYDGSIDAYYIPHEMFVKIDFIKCNLGYVEETADFDAYYNFTNAIIYFHHLSTEEDRVQEFSKLYLNAKCDFECNQSIIVDWGVSPDICSSDDYYCDICCAEYGIE